MRDVHPPSPCVVVGIDGSRSALTAALWAVGEAVARDVPLRLVYAIEPLQPPHNSEDAAHALATAEIAVRRVFTAVEAGGKPVEIEVEILQGPATDRLLEVSHVAVMLCLGVKGIKRATAGRAGSTAAKLAARADCPVAIIRGFETSPAEPGSVLVELDGAPDGDVVLQWGIDEALLRAAPLTVISVGHHHVSDPRDDGEIDGQGPGITAELDRRLERLARRHPGLDIRSAVAQGSLLDYLALAAQAVQLVVVGRRRAHGIAEMVGPPSYDALHAKDCSVLVCDPRNSL